MVNRRRGEVPLDLGGQRYTLCLTLGALAELEAALQAPDLAGLAERFAGGPAARRRLRGGDGGPRRRPGGGLRGGGSPPLRAAGGCEGALPRPADASPAELWPALPWDDLLALCLGRLGWGPAAFWAATPREIAGALAHGRGGRAAAPSRADLDRLIAAHPD